MNHSHGSPRRRLLAALGAASEPVSLIRPGEDRGDPEVRQRRVGDVDLLLDLAVAESALGFTRNLRVHQVVLVVDDLVHAD
jgi:hypothetical protein